jgi:hypothetical protein
MTNSTITAALSWAVAIALLYRMRRAERLV